MFKKMLFSAIMMCCALTANAQIATPNLDAGFHTYGGASVGWRYNSTINLVGVIADGKTDYNGEEGDVVAGFNAEGPESSGSIPFVLAAYRGETWGAEFYTNVSNGLNTDIEVELNIANSYDTLNIYKEMKENRLNLAYVFNERLSVGIEYARVNLLTKTELDAANYLLPNVEFDMDQETDITTTSMGLSVSYRLADVVFIAAGIEAVTENGTKKQDVVVSGSNISSYDGDYVENTWNNTFYGIGVIFGAPDETQFRAEYSVISSPESEEDADSDKAASAHPDTTTENASVELKWNGILIAFQNETITEKELNNDEKKSVTTLAGLGWQPMEGFTVSVYSYNAEVTMNVGGSIPGADEDITISPTGYRIFLGYNF